MAKKIYWSILLACAAVYAACLALIIGVLYSHYNTQQRDYLKEELALAASATELSGESYLSKVDAGDVRFTWIDSEGNVLYDSDGEASDMENHADREEVKQAFSEGYGESSRYSTTLMSKLVYYAQLLSDGTVLRISAEHITVPGLIVSMLQPILLIFAAAIIVSVILAYTLSRSIAKKLASVDLDKPLENKVYKELTPFLIRIDDQQRKISNDEEVRKEFTANVSHELKTPLQTIMGSAELMENGMVKAEDIPRFSGNIRKEAERQLSLINDIIKLSKLDECGEMEKKDVDMLAMAREEAERMKAHAQEAGVSVIVSADERAGKSADFTVRGVPELLHEIVHNLIDNAIKYNVKGGNVTVTLRRTARSLADKSPCGVEFEVKDTGIGIPKDQQQRIFERFYRVDKSHSREKGGTGLGLSIVKHAVMYHKGRIELESSPGKGTDIRVYL